MKRKAVLITGSSKGLGRSLALVFARENHDVILHGRDEKRLKFVEREVKQHDVDCDIVIGDLALDATIEQLTRTAKKRGISILINNAAINPVKSFDKFTMGEFKRVLDTNLVAPIKLVKMIYPHFSKKRKGLVININSTISLRVDRELMTAYAASKCGLKGFTDALRFESSKHNIRVIGVYLAGMKTDMYLCTGKDPTKCMETSEVAETIYDICKDYPSAGVNEMVIGRKRY